MERASLLAAGWLEKRAQEMATTMACQLELEGLLAVEMFVTQGDGLFVNELAPRPHNSYHASQRCCVTSQFEQAVRAVCDLPLGDVRIVRPAAIANLLGDLWLKGRTAALRGRWRCPRSVCTCMRNTLPGRGGRWAIFRRPRIRRKRRWPGFLKPGAGCSGRRVGPCHGTQVPTLHCRPELLQATA